MIPMENPWWCPLRKFWGRRDPLIPAFRGPHGTQEVLNSVFWVLYIPGLINSCNWFPFRHSCWSWVSLDWIFHVSVALTTLKLWSLFFFFIMFFQFCNSWQLVQTRKAGIFIKYLILTGTSSLLFLLSRIVPICSIIGSCPCDLMWGIVPFILFQTMQILHRSKLWRKHSMWPRPQITLYVAKMNRKVFLIFVKLALNRINQEACMCVDALELESHCLLKKWKSFLCCGQKRYAVFALLYGILFNILIGKKI